MSKIEVVNYEAAEGELKDIYDHLIKTRGKLADVHKIQSLNPPTILQHMDLYMGVMFGPSPLKRYQREMMAVVVSKANECEYCQLHHAEALNHYWKDEAKVTSLKNDFREVVLDPIDRAYCEMAFELTQTPSTSIEGARIDQLKNLGVGDRAILDATLVIAYFNFVNRIVLNLKVTPSEEEVKGYEYE